MWLEGHTKGLSGRGRKVLIFVLLQTLSPEATHTGGHK